MEFGDDNLRRVQEVEEDRLSSLPDEVIHKIMSCFDMKFGVQTCLLSSRWKLLWTSMPCLNLSSGEFDSILKFSEFVTGVLSHRNHQIHVSSVKLNFCGGSSYQEFVRKIADYALSHNAQELTINSCTKNVLDNYPPSIFGSRALKSLTPITPFDFSALTSLHLSGVLLVGDLLSKCLNLKNLTLEKFIVKEPVEVLCIISPRLSSLMLINGSCLQGINVIAPQLENLTISNCLVNYLNVPPGISSLCYTSRLWCCGLVQFSNDQFYSLNEVTICLDYSSSSYELELEDSHKTISMLLKLHTARYLTLDVGIIECISSFPDVLLHNPSPFSNLICLTIDYSNKDDAFKVVMSTEARNFLLENSPSATLIMKSPKMDRNPRDAKMEKLYDDLWRSTAELYAEKERLVAVENEFLAVLQELDDE